MQAAVLIGPALAAVLLAPIALGATPADWQSALAAGKKAYTEGRHAQAETHLRAALQAAEAFGPQDPRLATTLNELGLVYCVEHEYAQAETAFKRAATICEKTPGPERAYAATALNNLAVLCHLQHRDPEVEALFQRAPAIEEQTLGPEHPQGAAGLTNPGAPHYERGDYGKAAPLYQRAVAIAERTAGPRHPELVPILEDYAKVLQKLNRPTEAAQLEARAQAIRAAGR